MMKLSHVFSNLGRAFSEPVLPRALTNPKLVAFDTETAQLLELSNPERLSPDLQHYLSGNNNYDPLPVAMVYAGHQFGGYSPQLGDGRGVLLGERSTRQGRVDIHLKGVGQTPYSRFGDGHAVLRSCIREHLASIAMRGLGIPTSHSLCIIKGDNPVTREKVEPAAMLTRVAKTHIRFGSFEYFFHTKQHQHLSTLADYVIQHYYPELTNSTAPYDALFQNIVDSTASLIAKWQAVGFCHGVMNTDNMSILGETLDYGPYGFMESFNPQHICNTSDHQGRYSYQNQPDIGLWNLHTLAYAMSPLLETNITKKTLASYERTLNQVYAHDMLKKVGLNETIDGTQPCVEQLLTQMRTDQSDYTLTFNALTAFSKSIIDDKPDTHAALISLSRASKKPIDTPQWQTWLNQYATLLKQNTDIRQSTSIMETSNPIYTLRNSYAQQAIEAAYKYDDYTILHNLSRALSQPFTQQKAYQAFATLPASHVQSVAVSCSS